MRSKVGSIGVLHKCLETGKVGKLVWHTLSNDLVCGGNAVFGKYMLKSNDEEFISNDIEVIEQTSKEWDRLSQLLTQNRVYYEDLFKAVCNILCDYINEFHNCPGSDGSHHWYAIGLLEHTVGVVENVNSICSKYEFLDRHIMRYAGILHDVGKLKDYIPDTEQGWVMSDNRKLLGHCTEGVLLVKKYLDKYKVSEELQTYFLSVIGQHMGNGMASINYMNTPEAIYLNFADHMDALSEPIDKAKDLARESGVRWSKEEVGVAGIQLYFY